MSDDALAYLMSAGVPSAKFPSIGTTVSGRIRAYEKTQQRDIDGNPKSWDDGQPMWQIVFTLETDDRDPEIEHDDGTRKVYAKAQMLNAIREAVRATGHQGDLVGGMLAVKYTQDGPQKNRAYSAPKQYAAKFAPPAQTEDLGEPEPNTGDYDEEPF